MSAAVSSPSTFAIPARIVAHRELLSGEMGNKKPAKNGGVLVSSSRMPISACGGTLLADRRAASRKLPEPRR
jgi:hypothetical protein